MEQLCLTANHGDCQGSSIISMFSRNIGDLILSTSSLEYQQLSTVAQPLPSTFSLLTYSQLLEAFRDPSSRGKTMLCARGAPVMVQIEFARRHVGLAAQFSMDRMC